MWDSKFKVVKGEIFRGEFVRRELAQIEGGLSDCVAILQFLKLWPLDHYYPEREGQAISIPAPSYYFH
jgi:hypothetical protein